MASNVSHDEIQIARRVPLADFLNDMHPGELHEFSRGHWEKTTKHSVKVNRGIAGYQDWSSDESGNSIDYLKNYLGYSFVDAVKALCEYTGGVVNTSSATTSVAVSRPVSPSISAERPEFVLPEKMQGPFRQLYAYLTQTRKIPVDVINDLVHRDLLYQVENAPGCYNNIAFVSKDKDFYEMHGTNTYKSFHKSLGKNGNECWYFTGSEQTRPERIYVTEASIDAVSLYVLRLEPESCYAAIGGAGKQQAVDRLKSFGIPVIIATDNDAAGDECRSKNPDCLTIRPQGKDWNDDLKSRVAGA